MTSKSFWNSKPIKAGLGKKKMNNWEVHRQDKTAELAKIFIFHVYCKKREKFCYKILVNSQIEGIQK